MWETLFYQPIVNLLLVIYKLVGENLGFAIIGVVVLLRLVLLPLTQMQMKSSQKLKDAQPKLKKLQEKDRSELTMGEMSAMRDMGKGCAYGCLPTLVQLPFLISLYKALRVLASSSGTVFNTLVYGSYFLVFPEGYNFNTHFFGLDLALTPSTIGLKSPVVIPYAILIFFVGVAQWGSTKLMSAQREGQKSEEEKKKEAKDKEKAKKKGKKGKKEKEKSEKEMQEDMMQTTNNYMQMMFPVMIAFAAFSVPAALSIYWLVQSLFLIVQVGVTIKLQKRKIEREGNKKK